MHNRFFHFLFDIRLKPGYFNSANLNTNNLTNLNETLNMYNYRITDLSWLKQLNRWHCRREKKTYNVSCVLDVSFEKKLFLRSSVTQRSRRTRWLIASRQEDCFKSNLYSRQWNGTMKLTDLDWLYRPKLVISFLLFTIITVAVVFKFDTDLSSNS